METVNFGLDKELAVIRQDIIKIINLIYNENFSCNSIDDFFSAIQTASLRDRSLFSSVYDACNTLPSVFALIANNNLLRHFNGGLLVADLPKLRIDLPREDRHNDPWHQEAAYYDAPLDSVTIWIPLTEIDPDMGRLVVKRGSHSQPLIPYKLSRVRPYVVMQDGEWSKLEDIEACIPLGSGFIFPNNVIHRSGVNFSINKPRVSIQIRYNRLDSKEYVAQNLPRTFHVKSVHEDLDKERVRNFINLS